jgi:hypothetical protein
VQPPLAIEKRFQGVPLQASLEADRQIVLAGARYDSPAAAAAAARRRERRHLERSPRARRRLALLAVP